MKKMQSVCALLVIFMLAASALCAGQEQKGRRLRVLLYPRLTKGQTLRYQYELRRDSQSAAQSVIVDPNAGANEQLSLSVTLRIEVLDVAAIAGQTPARPAIKLRATFERVVAAVNSTAPAAEPPDTAQRRNALEGKSFECVLDPRRKMADCTAFEAAPPGAESEARAWLEQIFAAIAFPEKGIAEGENWADERAETGIPLARLAWVQKSTYLDNEPCEAPNPAADAGRGSASAKESCAAIRTQSLLTQRSKRDDATPEEFRAKNLRTSGTASGASESLMYISLATGLVTRATQSGWQKSDVTVTSLEAGTKIRYTTNGQTESHLLLIREP